MPRTPPGRQDPAAGPGPAPAVVTREASSWAHVHSQPHSPLLGVPCLSFPVRPIAPFIQGWVQCLRGAHLPRLLSGSCECPPGWAGGPREASSRWLPQHPEGRQGSAPRSGHLCTTSHGGAPFRKGVTRAPKAPVRGLLDSEIWPRALSGSEMGTMANSSAPQAPRAPGPAPPPSPGSSRSALRADSPHCHHRLPPSHGHDGTAPAAGGTSRPTCSRPRAWPVEGPREMFAGSRGTSGARKDTPLRAEVPPASL